MNKTTFLQALRGELQGNVSDEVILEQLHFYSEYITEEVAKGKGEEEVVSSLSEPHLLAQSIIDAADAAGDHIARTTPFRYEEKDINFASDEEDRQYGGTGSDRETASDAEEVLYEKYGEEGKTRFSTSEREREGNGGPAFVSFGNGGCILALLIVLLFLVLIVTVVGGVLSVLAPALLPVFAIAAVLWLISNILRR